MARYFIIPVLLLAFVFAAPVYAADKSSGDNTAQRGAGLACFTITPPKYPLRYPGDPEPNPPQPNCSGLCEAKGAGCTGVTSSMNPPQTCESGGADARSISCRCCAVTR